MIVPRYEENVRYLDDARKSVGQALGLTVNSKNECTAGKTWKC